MQLLSIAFAAASCFAVAHSAPAALVGPAPTVSAKSGPVVGFATTVLSAPSQIATVYNYLGVPFAAAPTGTRRFSPPEATSWSDPVQATSLPLACMQQFNYPAADAAFDREFFNNPGGPPPSESEDCLFLNVFAPTDASSCNKKPVLFWIFGGNLQFGWGGLQTYNGSSFAGFQDVVVVTINYRTNIFGYSNSPEIPVGKQNAGFLDQRLALQWVQENIENFGGDPEQVTIFGESAGGYSVKQMLAHPPEPLPFRAAIMESQQILVAGQGNKSYEQVVSQFGCVDASSQLECLQKVPATEIQQYIEMNSLGFPPVDDNITRSFDVRPSIKSGRFANVPILMGTNADEGRIFLAAMGLDGGNGSVESNIDMLLPGQDFLSKTLLAAYDDLQNDAFVISGAIVTDLLFTCSTSMFSNFIAERGHNVWRYFYNATYATESLFKNAGAYHSSEIPQVFGTYPLANIYGTVTPEQEGLSKYMQTAWANFAKNPSAGPGWSKVVGKDLLGGVVGALTGNLTGTEQVMQDLGGIDPISGVEIPTAGPDHACPILDPVSLGLLGF